MSRASMPDGVFFGMFVFACTHHIVVAVMAECVFVVAVAVAVVIVVCACVSANACTYCMYLCMCVYVCVRATKRL